MAKIDPWSIEYSTECYAAVEAEVGFHCGRIKGWKLYDLVNPDLRRTLSQQPSKILAAFTTREELEQWYEEYCGMPMPKPEPEKEPEYDLFNLPPILNLKMKSVHEILIYSFGEAPPKEKAAAAQWLQEQLRHTPEERRLEWVKPLRDKDTLAEKYRVKLTSHYLRYSLRREFGYGDFVEAVADMCIAFYQYNGGEMDEETKYFLEKNKMEFGYSSEYGQASLFDLMDEKPEEEIKLVTIGSGPNKLIISQIL